MFTTKNLVRMHDIDMAGILYFPRQFRFVHEALEDFMENEGIGFEKLFSEEKYLFVIVRCESDYLAPLRIGDRLKINMFVEDIGKTSFTLGYDIYKDDGQKAGAVKTVHVAIDRAAHKKIPLPEDLKKHLEKHFNPKTAEQQTKPNHP